MGAINFKNTGAEIPNKEDINSDTLKEPFMTSSDEHFDPISDDFDYYAQEELDQVYGGRNLKIYQLQDDKIRERVNELLKQEPLNKYSLLRVVIALHELPLGNNSNQLLSCESSPIFSGGVLCHETALAYLRDNSKKSQQFLTRTQKTLERIWTYQSKEHPKSGKLVPYKDVFLLEGELDSRIDEHISTNWFVGNMYPHARDTLRTLQENAKKSGVSTKGFINYDDQSFKVLFQTYSKDAKKVLSNWCGGSLILQATYKPTKGFLEIVPEGNVTYISND